MKTLYLIGYHDSYPINLNDFKELPCFSKGTIYLVEFPLSIDSAAININELKRECDLEAKLHELTLYHTNSSNIAQLMNFEPRDIIPCATETKDNGKVYGSPRDKEVLDLVTTAINLLPKNVENVAFFGGSKHAKYMNEKLSNCNPVLYDLRFTQANRCLELKNVLIRDNLI